VSRRLGASGCGGFDQQLSRAYGKEYGTRDILESGTKSYVYDQRITFIDTQSEKRIGYTIGSYVQLTAPSYVGVSDLTRIDHIFTDEIGESYAFVYVEILEETGQIGDIRQFTTYWSTGKRSIYGLPAIAATRPYMLPVIPPTNGLL